MTDDNSASISNVTADSATKAVSITGTAGTFTDGAQTQKFSASAAHGGSARKGVSNLGNLVNATNDGIASNFASADKGIAANASMTKNGTVSFTATGYRAWFLGMLDYIPTNEEITSEFIRDLNNRGEVAAYPEGAPLQIKPGEAEAKSVVIALPQSAGTLVKVLLTSSMNSDITKNYTNNLITVQVTDASEAEGTEAAYNVYIYKPAALGSDEVHAIQIAKK